jgi:hypothetical protein
VKETTFESLAKNPQGGHRGSPKGAGARHANGRPSALVIGLENYDEEDWGYMTSRAFWEMIRERRKEPTVRLEDVRDELLRDD